MYRTLLLLQQQAILFSSSQACVPSLFHEIMLGAWFQAVKTERQN